MTAATGTDLIIGQTESNACFDAQNKAKGLVYLLGTNSEIVNKTL